MTEAAEPSWAEQKAKHKNTHVPVRIALAGDLWVEHARLEHELRQALADDERLNRTPEAPAIAEKVREVEQQMRASEVEFVFRGIGRRRMAKMLADHPATEAQQKAAEAAGAEQPIYDQDTFPPELLAASCVKPAELAGNVEEWSEIHDEWNDGQVARLWNACQQANARVADTPFSLAASEILGRRH